MVKVQNSVKHNSKNSDDLMWGREVPGPGMIIKSNFNF